MNKTFLAFLLITLMACGPHNSTDNSETNSMADYLLKDGFIAKSLTSNHQRLIGKTGDLKSLKQYLNRLDDDSLTSIPFALDYILTCIPSDYVFRDSIFLLFNRHFDR